MRLIAILLALLIVGLLVNKQMGLRSDEDIEELQAAPDLNVPKVPTNPNEVNQFGTQMDDYMEKEAARREAALKEAESR